MNLLPGSFRQQDEQDWKIVTSADPDDGQTEPGFPLDYSHSKTDTLEYPAPPKASDPVHRDYIQSPSVHPAFIGGQNDSERPPELMDNVVYRDERRTPSRYARYESIRLENDRAHSRPPVYAQAAFAQPGQYHETAPVYKARTPRTAGSGGFATYGRKPQPEPEPRETSELVKVTDWQGEYVVRRPVVRPGEAEPERTVYESRAPPTAIRGHEAPPASYEEYDTRHPPTSFPIEEEPYTINCICEYSDDDGNTILCERCDTWQHIECYYSGHVEDASREDFDHLCTDCNPRPVDAVNATERQRTQRESVQQRNKRPNKQHKRVDSPIDDSVTPPHLHGEARAMSSKEAANAYITPRTSDNRPQKEAKDTAPVSAAPTIGENIDDSPLNELDTATPDLPNYQCSDCGYIPTGEEKYKASDLRRHRRIQHGPKRHIGSSQPMQFESEVLEKLTQDMADLRKNNSEKDQQLTNIQHSVSGQEEEKRSVRKRPGSSSEGSSVKRAKSEFTDPTNSLAPELSGSLLSDEQEEDDGDIESIASLKTYRDSALGTSIPSAMSLGGLPKTAQEEVLFIISSDSDLKQLLQDAVRKMDDKPRFVRNIKRLLLMFHGDLQAKVTDGREKDAAMIIQRHAEWFANRLYDICDPESISHAAMMAALRSRPVDKVQTLENYLASKGSYVPQERKKNIDIEEDSGDKIDYSKFPNLEYIKNFIVGGPAFDKLRYDTRQFVFPVERAHLSGQNAHPEKNVQEPEMKFASLPTSIPLDASSHTSSSTATTSITVPDLDSERDNDSADLSSDPELYDEPQEERISDPKAYFESLAALERELFENSGICAYKNGISNSHDEDRFFLRPPAVSLPLVGINSEAIIPLIQFTKSEKLLHLWETYNLAVRIWKNLISLRDFGFCQASISFLTKDQDRSNVASLIQIEIQPILTFVQDIEDILGAASMAISQMQIAKATRRSVNRYIEDQDQARHLTSRCSGLFTSMGLLHPLLFSDDPSVIWQCAFQALDLVVLSYAGSHIQRFDRDLLHSETDAFQIPRRFVYRDETLQSIASISSCQSIVFRRRQLQCLDTFLGEKQPWVLHQGFSDNDIGHERLCLATTIGALTDLWGPSWKIVNNAESDLIKQFDIGNGAIVPWSANYGDQQMDMKLHPSEVFCHWIASTDWDPTEIALHQSTLPRVHFLESDTLLVGASSNFGLLVNENCIPSLAQLSSIKTKLDQQGGLRTRNTHRSQRYIDSHAVQIQGTAMGIISGAGIITYKRREGHTMKDALVERWRHKLRNPMDLEAFSGVEISLCTGNARRRRLLHLLNSPTIRNYLHSITFPWISKECEYSYYKALRCPKSFRKFWKSHPEYRENVGDAISACLDALEETGVNEDSRELRGLWVESFDNGGDSDGESDEETDDEDDQKSSASSLAKPRSIFFEEWIVTLFRSEYTWTGFLEDSEESLTMCVVVPACLDFDHMGYGRRCTQAQCVTGSKGYPVLQTSLQLNESILKGEKLKRERLDAAGKAAWDAKEVKKGSSFSLGNHGTLKVLTSSSNTCPVIMEWSGVKSETMKEVKNVAINEKVLGRNAERHHREHIRGTWESKPLPVLVLSKSTKVAFSGH